MKDGVPIPILDDDLRIIGTMPFKDNLTVTHAPEYVNYNGYVGLALVTGGIYEGELVIMYYDKHYPKNSYGEIISRKDAYVECLNRGKLDVAKELGLTLKLREREVI